MSLKKPIPSLLVIVTVVFAVFTLGFFFGRNRDSGEITVNVPDSMLTEPAQITEPPNLPSETAPNVVFPVNINTASKDELMHLPGIGEVLAFRIIAYRENQGPFSTPADLMHVEGIGEKRMEEIMELLTTGG